MNWISVEESLPDYQNKGDGISVEVHVKTEHGLYGKCRFAYTGAPGEPMSGLFWMPIRDAYGTVGLKNDITHWMYVA